MATPTPTPGFDPNAPLPDLGFRIPTMHEIHMAEGAIHGGLHLRKAHSDPVILVMAITFAVIGFVWTATRLWIRRKSWWWDDLSAGTTSLFQIMQMIVLVAGNRRAPSGKLICASFSLVRILTLSNSSWGGHYLERISQSLHDCLLPLPGLVRCQIIDSKIGFLTSFQGCAFCNPLFCHFDYT
jgi:hypothetical protein